MPDKETSLAGCQPSSLLFLGRLLQFQSTLIWIKNFWAVRPPAGQGNFVPSPSLGGATRAGDRNGGRNNPGPKLFRKDKKKREVDGPLVRRRAVYLWNATDVNGRRTCPRRCHLAAITAVVYFWGSLEFSLSGGGGSSWTAQFTPLRHPIRRDLDLPVSSRSAFYDVILSFYSI